MNPRHSFTPLKIPRIPLSVFFSMILTMPYFSIDDFFTLGAVSQIPFSERFRVLDLANSENVQDLGVKVKQQPLF